jgi:hypothetical protein|tara:strand:+ start:924 stop:1097 length:174 start_codon:yes stop_codon:yes gene_type:complete
MFAPKIKLQKPIDVVISDVQILKKEIAELKLQIKKINMILTGDEIEDKIDKGWTWWS